MNIEKFLSDFEAECKTIQAEANQQIWKFDGIGRMQAQYERDGVCATADRLQRWVKEAVKEGVREAES